MYELDEPRPVPAGISAMELISTPCKLNSDNISLTIGCFISLMFSTNSVFEYFTWIFLSKNGCTKMYMYLSIEVLKTQPGALE